MTTPTPVTASTDAIGLQMPPIKGKINVIVKLRSSTNSVAVPCSEAHQVIWIRPIN